MKHPKSNNSFVWHDWQINFPLNRTIQLEKVETAETNRIESKLSQQIYRQTDKQTDRQDRH
jgi:hypothetical protein